MEVRHIAGMLRNNGPASCLTCDQTFVKTYSLQADAVRMPQI